MTNILILVSLETVALDWHNDTVDELLASFSNINTSVERTGNFSSMERHMLFQVRLIVIRK